MAAAFSDGGCLYEEATADGRPEMELGYPIKCNSPVSQLAN